MSKPAKLDTEQLRQTMRAWSSGVTIVTVAYQGLTHGMTVSSFTSVALDPPLVIVSLQADSRTHELISKAGTFAVTILSADQAELSDRFAGRIPDTEDRMAGQATETLLTGAPLLQGGLAFLDCRTVQVIPAGSNTLFLAEVLAARSARDGEAAPLVYHNQRYRQLQE
jgi:flavin reductase (DIM6/NTAB) family NADH-FMN oxidoreductase RutF